MNFSVPTIEAHQFNREMISGRTKPCVVTCAGGGLGISEQVIKLRAAVNFNETGLTCELVSALLAKKLGLSIPDPSIILVSSEFAEAISIPSVSKTMQASVGLNFGSTLITGGPFTWPVDKSLTPALEEKAAEIIAFDAMIQNPDRRVDKPNVLWKGQEIYIIDHEMAFSFLHILGPAPQPYTPEAFAPFLRNHLFYRPLKGKDLKLDRFIAAMKLIKQNDIESIFKTLPTAWKNETTPKIKAHLLSLLEQSSVFIDSVRRVAA